MKTSALMRGVFSRNIDQKSQRWSSVVKIVRRSMRIKGNPFKENENQNFMIEANLNNL